MSRTPDLFPELKPPRQAPRKLMHVCDSSGDCCDDTGTGMLARLRCPRCGHETGWMAFRTASEAKRGEPCPLCNGAPHGRP